MDVNRESILSKIQTAAIHGFSDHCLVACKIAVPLSRFNAFPKTYRDFKYFNYDSFYADLINTPFYRILDAYDIDSKVSIFYNLVHTLLISMLHLRRA